MGIDYKKITEFLKLRRFEMGKSQQDMANFLEISPNTYRKYENNPYLISLEAGLKINKILKCNIFQFFLDTILHNATKQ